MSVAIETASIPRRIGVYQLDAKIGSGAMGTVYRATHTTLGKEVALKLVEAEDPDGELCQRLLLEGVAASRVRHPNVVSVLDAGHDGTRAYLAMQLLDGETLAECLQRHGRLPVTTAIDLILPVCAALMAAHTAGVLHRDLKPANIFLADVGRGEPEPMLLDFGISKILGPMDAALTQNPRFLGTPLYIAPEQADGAGGSPASDQYSLALSLYEALLGVRPFEKYKASLVTLLRRVAEGEIRPACELDASVPLELSDALARALSLRPEDRFASLRELGGALLPFASEARRVLWQHAFVDTERTMASVHAPIDNAPTGRRVSVSVEPAPTRSRAPSSWPQPSWPRQPGEETPAFLSHSEFFGSEANPSSAFPPERSAISRRNEAPGQRLSSTQLDHEAWYRAQQDQPRRGRPGPAGAPPGNGVDAPRQSAPASGGHKNNRVVIALSALLALVTLLSTAVLLRHELGRNTYSSYAAQVRVHPAAATVQLDGHQVGQGSFVGTFLRDGRTHQLRFAHDGYEALTLVFQDSPPPPFVRLKKLALPEAPSSAQAETSQPPAPSSRKRSALAGRVRSAQDRGTAAPLATLPPDALVSTPDTPLASLSGPDDGGQFIATSEDSTQNADQAGTLALTEATNQSDVPDLADLLELRPPEPPSSRAMPNAPSTSTDKRSSIRTGNLDPWAN